MGTALPTQAQLINNTDFRATFEARYAAIAKVAEEFGMTDGGNAALVLLRQSRNFTPFGGFIEDLCWQRGDTFAAVGNGDATADGIRWYQVGAGVVTHQKSTTAPDGTPHALHIDVTTADASLAAGDYYAVEIPLEGYHVQSLAMGGSAANYTVISFKIRSTRTGTLTVAISNDDRTRCYTSEITIDAANVFETKSVIVPGAPSGTWLTDNGIGMRVHLVLAAGSDFHAGSLDTWNATNTPGSATADNFMDSTSTSVYLGQLKVEQGRVATPWIGETPEAVNAHNQRYFQQWGFDLPSSRMYLGGGYVFNATTVLAHFDYPEMRAAPTLTGSSGATFEAHKQSSGGSTYTLTLNSGADITRRSMRLSYAGTSMTSGEPVVVSTQQAGGGWLKLDAAL